MANRRPALTEQDLRETKSNLLGAVNKQIVDWGGIPDTRAAEDFVLPILGKVEYTHEDDRRRDLVAPDRQDAYRDIRDERMQRREQQHNERLRGLGIKTTFINEDMGDVHVDWDRNVASTTVELARPGIEGPATRATRKRFRELAKLPEWKRRILDVFNAPLTASQREAAYKRILKDSVKLFGDPRFGDL
jgi:hypothetical protein